MAAAPPFPFGLCAFDIDGTLVENGKLSARTHEAIKAARARGAAIVLATGRPPAMAAGIPKLLDYDLDYVICANGGQIFSVTGGSSTADWKLAVEPGSMSRATVTEISESILAEMPHVEFLISDEHLPTDPSTEAMCACTPRTMEVGFGIFGPNMVERMQPTVSYSKPAFRKTDKPVWSFIAIFDTPAAEADMAIDYHLPAEEQAAIERTIETVLSTSTNPEVAGWKAINAGLRSAVEIALAGNSKEETLQRLVVTLGLTAADAIAFGDGLNDVGMLRWAEQGCAMGNAESEAVKEAADRVIGTCAEDGVAIVLEAMVSSSASCVAEYTAATAAATAAAGAVS